MFFSVHVQIAVFSSYSSSRKVTPIRHQSFQIPRIHIVAGRSAHHQSRRLLSIEVQFPFQEPDRCSDAPDHNQTTSPDTCHPSRSSPVPVLVHSAGSSDEHFAKYWAHNWLEELCCGGYIDRVACWMDLHPLSSPVSRHSSLVHSCVGSMHAVHHQHTSCELCHTWHKQTSPNQGRLLVVAVYFHPNGKIY